ncbi:DUF6274 family protein [Streptomyces odonnellii]|uniref:DUF6274 family protein n=1 Tax=Streptomyces odonnellii TaxID=1417980 RepID=UPI000626691F|nr:DUF6274 family protein [Streptomyces odonnellii]
MSSTARHRTSALLRAHLAAASGRPHRTGYCPICHRLQRLAMESLAGDDGLDGFVGGFLDDELPDDLAPSTP